MNRRLRGFLTLAIAILTLAFGSISSGQVLKGSISGTVTNSGGNVVSGAQIKATNTETGAVYTTTSDASGLFRMVLLPVGNFKVEISAQGLQSTRDKVTVVAGADSGLGAVSLGQTAASEPAAESAVGATQSQTTNSFSGTTLNFFSGIQENQGLDRMALFVPGVINSRGDNFSIINGAAFSASGLRGRGNDQQIDGQGNNESVVTGPSLLLSDPNFVQQYVLVTNNFGPEYGRNAASVVNVITKQGGNAWHGSIYGAENNSFLNALSNSQKQTPLPGGGERTGPPRSNQEFSGFTIGGPWVKNKVFVFGGFDDQIFSGSNVFTTGALTPTPAGLAQLAGCGPAINGTALQVLSRFGPYGFSEGNPSPLNLTLRDIRSGPTGSGPIVCPAVEFGNVIRTVSTPSREFNWIYRMDLQLGSDTITGRYLFNRNTSFNNGDNAAGGWFFNTPQFSQAALLSWTHNLSAHMVNEARVEFSRFNIQFGGNDTGNPFEPKLSNIDDAFTNITIQGGFLGIGPAVNIPQGRISNTWQAQDNWNYVRGKHQFKAGVNWTYQRSPNVALADFNGQFRFTNASTFLTTDQPNTIVIANGDPGIDFREHDTFLYVGDDWKLRQNLTLNLGLAWSYYSQPANLFHDITTERESSASTAFWGTTVGGVSVPLSARTTPTVPAVKNNFGPSVGFAYSPQWGGFLTGHGKTVIRGGYRFLYDPPFYNIYLNSGRSAPMVFLQTLTGASAAANPLPALPLGSNVRAQLAPFIQKGVFDPRTFNQTDISPDFRPDKVQAWSFGFERELSKNSAVEARYVGNHATNLFQSVNGNPFVADLQTDFPTLVPAGLTPCATNTIGLAPGQTIHPEIGRVSCNQGVVETRGNGAYSNYHALQLEFRATNLFKQLTLRSGYTWSKTLDNTSEIFSTGGAGNTSAFAQNPLQTGRDEYSISGLHVPRAWNITFIEQLPFFKEQRGFAGHLLGGWGLSGNYIVASGQPYTPVQGFGEAFKTSSGNYYDSAFIGAFTGSDVARPFFGSPSAPADSVGIFASDFCRGILNITPAANAALPGICNTGITSPLQLVSINSLNSTGSLFSGPGLLPGQAPVTVTKDQVRFIINGGAAQAIFGTPFGNVPRNALTDGIQNIANFSVFKNLKLSEHASFQFHATALNALNHYNFANVDVVLEDAGLKRFGVGFANPSANSANGRSVFIGGKLTW